MKLIRYLPNPIFVNIYVTNECNLRCKHCIDNAGHLSEEQKSEELSNGEIYYLIDYYLSKGVSNISFSGGEPLLHKNLLDFIKYLKNKNVDITLLTNATLVDKNIARSLAESGVSYVRTSIEGANSETHDWIRGEGNFEKVIFGLKNLLEAKLPKVGVSITLNKRNLHEIEIIISMLYKIGIRYLTMAPLMPLGRGEKYLKEFILSRDEFKNLLIKKQSLEKVYPDVIFTLDSPLQAILVKDDPISVEKLGPCVIGTCFLGFKSNGDIYACPVRDEVIIGNMRIDDLQDIWDNSPFLNRVRNLDLLEGKCKNCNLLQYCGGGCRALTHIKYDDVIYPDPYCWL